MEARYLDPVVPPLARDVLHHDRWEFQPFLVRNFDSRDFRTHQHSGVSCPTHRTTYRIEEVGLNCPARDGGDGHPLVVLLGLQGTVIVICDE